jgi:hypothetical protein
MFPETSGFKYFFAYYFITERMCPLYVNCLGFLDSTEEFARQKTLENPKCGCTVRQRVSIWSVPLP